LKKIPAIGRLDVERNAFCLRALAEHFGEREQERHDRDQQRDLLVSPFPSRLSAAAAMFFTFDVMLDFVLDRVHAMAHVTLPRSPDLSKPPFCAPPDRALVTRADARCDRLPSAARYRPRCKFASSIRRRAQAALGWRAGRLREPTDAWRMSDAAHAGSRFPAGRAHRATVPSQAGQRAAI